MARDSSGIHTLPTGNPVVSGSAISSTVHNATQTDISLEITDSLSRSGKGGMSAPLVITAGTVSLPSIAPTGDLDSGIYAPAANEIAIATGGAQRLKVSSAGVNVTGAMAATGAVSGTTGTFTGAVSGTTGTFSGAGAFGGDLDMNTHKITELTAGTAATDAVALSQITPTTVTHTLGGTNFTVSLVGTKVLGIVTLYFSATAGAGSTWANVTTLDAGFRPAGARDFTAIAVDTGTATYPAIASIAANGVVSLSSTLSAGALGTPFTIAATDVVTFSASFVAA